MNRNLLYILCCFYFSFYATIAKSQSIEKYMLAVKNAKHDTTKLHALLLLVDNIEDDSIWPIYNEQALKLGRELLKSPTQQVKISAKRGLAFAINNEGFIFQSKGSIEKALNSFSESLKLQEELGDKLGMAGSIANIAVIFADQGEIEKAIEYNNRSLKIRTEINDEEGLVTVLNNLAFLYKQQNETEKAIHYLEKCIVILENGNDEDGIATVYNNLGSIILDKGDKINSKKYFFDGLAIRRKMSDRVGMTASFINISSWFICTKDFKFAKTYADSALKFAKEQGIPEFLQSAELRLAKIDSATGNFKGAFQHHKNYIFYRDSLNNEATKKASIKTQFKYEYDKKEALLNEQQEKERAIAEEKNRKNRIIIISVICGLLIVVAFLIIVFRSLQQNKRANRIITLQKEVVEKQKKTVEEKNHIIEEKQKEIIDSINYAKRIQYTLLAHDEFLRNNLPAHFVLFHPKDIVSGDFYWAAKKENKFYLAVCDSTGHGVPGAFMSLLNIGFLSEAINEKDIEKPNEVLDYVRQRLIDSISKDGQKDGFDGILLCINKDTNEITYAAANNAPIVISNNEIIELNADRMPVGQGERKENFSLHSIDYVKGTMLYLYTDGYADQFGGPKGKKFKYKPLNEMILKNSKLDLAVQKQELLSTFHAWKNWSNADGTEQELEQVDDVCIIGIQL